MTYKEKLQIEFPDAVNEYYVGGCHNCPHVWGFCNKEDTLCGYLKGDRINAKHDRCTKCWNQTIPETKKKIKKLPPDEKKKTWKATYAEFTDGHREEIFYCSGIDNSIPIEFATESGMYVYYEKPTQEIYELHNPTTPRLTFKNPRQCFHKVTTYLNYGELNVVTVNCYNIHHIEFEEVEVDG